MTTTFQRASGAASLLSLALLSAFHVSATAQSSVTIYGQIDVAAGKYDGTNVKTLGTGSTSRLGFRGVEDLGGGLKTLFQLETQINPDTGTQANSAAFWSGRSTVGLEGRFGRVTLGREVNPSHFVEAAVDPFGQDGMAGGYGARGGISQANGAPGAIDTVRMNNSINYFSSVAGFTFRAQTALREGVDPNGNQPWSASLLYSAGPVLVGVSHINPSKVNDQWTYVSGAYDLGVARLSAGFGSGKNTFNQSIRNTILGASIPAGNGVVKTSFSRSTSDGTTVQAKAALGYHYSLSKRTTVYADLVHDSKAGAYAFRAAGWAPTGTSLGKTGYDVGLKHVF